ncbi:acetylglutamate/acetylaminoadipate kinase [Pyrococcus sp. NA2]|uniref:[LysW]-aminoadipate/[LysW]-glutamate kinase n=1 Tax=Pyrococcus sp. (strain NA2) TaxID=342949 RepID=UPI000209A8F7|nr:[LysW]-aminoadipate/[LysW]-glutamate kinase [Pyrococcus sp. NA2]AEC51245.1 acetylglutamate/acetylaminoadipate kinase [Pyrococcus sp. NA2]
MRVIKVGGSVLDNLDKLFDYSAFRSSIVVHGGSRYVDELARKLGVKIEKLTSPSGVTFRRTTREVLDIYIAAIMKANTKLVSFLRERGIEAIGVSGVKDIIIGRRKKLVKALINGKVMAIRDDYSGIIKEVNVNALKNYLKVGVPVIAPIAYDPMENVPLNVDGDKVAYHVALAMGAKELLFISDTAFLVNDTVVNRIPVDEVDDYLRYASGGMKKKLMMAKKAVEGGVKKVVIQGLNGRTVIS